MQKTTVRDRVRISRSRQADAAAQGEPGAPPSRQRDAFFDNAKYLAIVLVAVGHAWEPLRGDSRAVTAVYMAVYAFHMPAFILIAGYFSRSFDGRADRVQRLITGIAVPYAAFQILYAIFNRWIYADPEIEVHMFTPFWITWFLMALFIWRLTVPLWNAVRWPVPLALTVAVLASVSPYIGSTLDLHRVLQFLPYFVVGLVLRPHHFELLRRRAVRLWAVAVFALALPAAYWAVPRMEYAWFYHRESAQELGVSWWAGVMVSLLIFVCSMTLSACFLALVPSRRTWFTVLGAGTLYGYLLHGFLARGSREWGWYDTAWMDRPVGPVVVSLTAAAVVTVLCTPPVRRALRPVVEPSLDWAFRRQGGDRGTDSNGGSGPRR